MVKTISREVKDVAIGLSAKSAKAKSDAVKDVKKKFGERKNVQEISSVNDKIFARRSKSNSTDKTFSSMSTEADDIKDNGNRRTMKRKGFDEVDSACSSLKMKKVDESADAVLDRKLSHNQSSCPSSIITKDVKKKMKKVPREDEKVGIAMENAAKRKQLSLAQKGKKKSKSKQLGIKEHRITHTSGETTSGKHTTTTEKNKIIVEVQSTDLAHKSGPSVPNVMHSNDPLAILMMMEGCSSSHRSSIDSVSHETKVTTKADKNKYHQSNSDQSSRSQNKPTNIDKKKKKTFEDKKQSFPNGPKGIEKKKISKQTKPCVKTEVKSASAGVGEKSQHQAAPKDASDKHKTKQTKKKVLKTSKSDPASEAGPSTTKVTDSSDPLALLMMMEGRSASQPEPGGSNVFGPVKRRGVKRTADSSKNHGVESDGSEELSDWEEVQDHPMLNSASDSQLPDKPVEITMDLPNIFKKKKKKKAFDWKAYFEQKMRRFQKEVAANLHKAHLLCLLASGIRQNAVLSNPTLSAVILSIAPSNFTSKAGASEERQVENIMTWYRKKFPLDLVTHASQNLMISVASMVKAISKASIVDARMWVFVFISLLRTLGFNVRLVLSLQPMPFKPGQVKDHQTQSSKLKQPPKCKSSSGKTKGKAQKEPTSEPKKGELNEASSKSSSSKSSSAKSSKSKYFKSDPKSASSSTPSPSSSSSSLSSKPKRILSARKSKEKAELKNRQNLKDEETDDDIFTDEEKISGGKRETKKTPPAKKVIKDKDIIDSDSDSEFEASPSFHLKKDLKIKSNRKVLSVSSDNDEAPSVTNAHDFWMELYVSDKKKWICFDCFKVQFGKPYSLEASATQPLSYVVGFKNDNGMKDVTARYAKQWLSQTRKLRVDADWVSDTFSFFDVSSYEERIMEEDDIKSQLLVRPMPTSIGDFKNHPLYALQRHLLKFEAIYPETAIPLGYIRKEPIYARECVRLLHSRDNWLKEGRLVRLKEEPYKMVKSRPKWNKPKDNPDELDLELFGDWQTEKYIPPPAVNGKVPRNDYGNVELFQPWMLPQGTVHLRVQGLQKVAKKLGVDVAPAMIGWDYHSGYSHPVMDGWVVCEEFADTLLEAWDEDQEIQRQREEEKRDKRVYGNWKRLIRGLLIKENLKDKFLKEKTLVTAATSQKLHEEEEEHHFPDVEPAVPAEQFWPRNRQEEEKAEHTEKVQKHKNQLTKERENRRLQAAMRLDDEDHGEGGGDSAKAKKSRRPAGKNSIQIANKSNSGQKEEKKFEPNKTESLKFKTLNLSDDEEDENDNIVMVKKDHKFNNNKVEARYKVRRARTKRRMKDEDEEDEDETYTPASHAKRRHEEIQESDCANGDFVKRVTRSRQRCS